VAGCGTVTKHYVATWLCGYVAQERKTMSQQFDTGTMPFTAGVKLEAQRRVKMSGTNPRTVIYAGAGEPALRDFKCVTDRTAGADRSFIVGIHIPDFHNSAAGAYKSN